MLNRYNVKGTKVKVPTNKTYEPLISFKTFDEIKINNPEIFDKEFWIIKDTNRLLRCCNFEETNTWWSVDDLELYENI